MSKSPEGEDLLPCVVRMVAALSTIVRVPEIGSSSLLQLLAFYGFPLAIGLFLHQGLLLAWATKGGYARTVWRRLPAALISTNLALAELLAVGLPATAAHLNVCGLGAVVGGLLLYAHHAWAVRRGFAAWSALRCGPGDAGDDTTTLALAPWRSIWLWVPLSFVALAAGTVLGAMGTTWVAGAAK